MAKTILQKLFDGEIYPSEKIVPKSSEYKELFQKLIEKKNTLGRGFRKATKNDLKRLKTYQMILLLSMNMSILPMGFKWVLV